MHGKIAQITLQALTIHSFIHVHGVDHSQDSVCNISEIRKVLTMPTDSADSDEIWNVAPSSAPAVSSRTLASQTPALPSSGQKPPKWILHAKP